MKNTTKKRKRGRPRLNNSETKLRTYKISQRDYQSFLDWCRSRNLKPTTMIRSLIIHAYTKGMIEDLDLKEIKELKRK